MTLPSKTFQQVVDDMTASWGQQIGQTVAFSSGDGLLALFQSVSSQIMFLQAQAAILVKLTRATTSTGADLDAWMADYNFPREPAVAASGEETFSRNTAATASVNIPAATLNSDGTYSGGTIIQNNTATIQYRVIPDTAQPTYNATLNAYVLAAGSTSLLATVKATIAGASSNVAQNVLGFIGSSLIGIDTATNLDPISNGFDAESDTAYRARFINYIASLSKATKAAIQNAINSVQQGLTSTLLENQNAAGLAQPGCFTAIIDDGSGNPPAALLTAVYNAIDTARGFTVQQMVVGPNLVDLTIVTPVRYTSGYDQNAVKANVITAIINYVNGVGTGGTVAASRIVTMVSAVPGVDSVEISAVTINGVNGDFIPSTLQRAFTSSALITVSTY